MLAAHAAQEDERPDDAHRYHRGESDEALIYRKALPTLEAGSGVNL